MDPLDQTLTSLNDEEIEIPEEAESIEDSIRASMAEAGESADEPQADPLVQGDKSQDAEKPAINASEAASILAKSKNIPKTGKKKVIEGKSLDPEPQPAPAQAPPAAQGGEKIDPPVQFSVQDKEWFNQQDPVVKRNISETFKNIQAHSTKIWQDLNREKEEVSQVRRIVSNYRPGWNLKNMTDAQAISELCAVQDMCVKDPIRGADTLLRKMNITPEQLFQYRKGASPGTGAPSSQPAQQNNYLTKDEVSQIIQQENQRQLQAQAHQAAVSEIEQVRGQVRADGTYEYPELWDQNYLKRVEPLVDDIRKNNPGVSWSEAVKRGTHVLRTIDGKPGIPSPGNPRLTNQAEIAKARAASVSIKGRGNPMTPQTTEAKKGESIEDSIRAAMSMNGQS